MSEQVSSEREIRLDYLLGVLLFGISNSFLDVLFANDFYGFFFYPAFLVFLFIGISKLSTPEKSFETVLGAFNLILLLIFFHTFYYGSSSYLFWGIILLGGVMGQAIGRNLIAKLNRNLLWHYYFAISCSLTLAHGYSFYSKPYEYASLGVFLLIIGIGFIIPHRTLIVAILFLWSSWSYYHRIPYFEGKPDQPNLLLITVDTLRQDGLSCYGASHQTPTIDNLAKNGVLYENAYATSSWTLPSVYSILTGLYPSALGLGMETYTNNLPPLTREASPLALVLRRKGYRTIGMVSNYWLTKSRQIDIGFDQYKNFQDPYCPPKDEPQALYLRVVYWMFETQYFPSGKYLLEEAYTRLKKGKGSYFLWVHLLEPHLPYDSKLDLSKYKEERGNLADYFKKNVDQDSVRKGLWKLTPEARKFLRWWYDRQIAQTDKILGVFLDRLKEEGYLDNTLIVFASDHGEEFWDHGSVVHGHTLYNELLRVPLIFNYPKKLESKRVKYNVSHTQIYPTILNLLDITEKPKWRPPDLTEKLPFVFSESVLYFEDRKALISQENWKYIRLYGQDTEIYNLDKDPKEKVSLKIPVREGWKKNFESWVQENQSINEILEKGRNSIQISEEEYRKLESIGY